MAPSIPPPPPLVETPGKWLARAQQNTTKPLGAIEEETVRILSLPVQCPAEGRCPDPEAYGASFLSPHTPDPTFRLWTTQIDALWTFETYGGLMGAISVGRGKAYIAILAAVRAVRTRGHYRVVVMVPPDVFDQFTKTDLPRARQLFNTQGVAFHVCAGHRDQRYEVTDRSGPGVWVYSYSSLSTVTGFAELKRIRATCYIMDEAQKLANPKSARTKRFQTVLNELTEEGVVRWGNSLVGRKQVTAIECVTLSGTLTKKSIKDYAHLSARCLGILAPAPIRQSVTMAYAAILDSGVDMLASEARTLKQFLVWAKEQGFEVTKPVRQEEETDTEFDLRCRVGLTMQEQLRLAYMHRLRTSPGVISTEGQGVDSSLTISWVEPPRPPGSETQEMIRLMQQVVVKQETPSGDIIEYGMHQFKWLWEISSGFYNNLVWPNGSKVQEDYPKQFGRDISSYQAEALLVQAKKHHELLQVYHKELRQFLDSGHRPHCDTPLLVANEIIKVLDGAENKYRLPPELMDAYREQRQEGPHIYKDLPKRFSTPVFVSDYKVDAAIAWAKEHGEGLIWYHHPFIGRRISQRLKEEGVAHTFAPAGQNDKAFAKGLVVASYAHGTGKNLQHQSKNLFVELRREAAVMEQAVGRTHRSGQLADTVEVYLLIGNGFDLALFNGTLRDADYAQSTLGQRQRLCYADYNPVIPPIDPRLMIKLGIVKHQVSGLQVQAWESITPPGMEEVANLFRPEVYGTAKVRA